ncbi:hypothetical protein BASA81_006738 [Batrachochytrium salamandrivorans]|nr:hypothetical protein BASA81_006738 [Batrachochytrium salamandrivorans]
MFRRALSTASAASAKAAPKRESTFVKIWIKRSVAAWPIIGISIGASLFAGYKVYQTLSGPDYHFNKHERSTVDYVENNRDPKAAEAWGNSAFHKGPEFIRKNLIQYPK